MGSILGMNETQRDEIEQRIRALLTDLEADDTRGRDSQTVVTLDQQSVGRLSRMDALQNQAMALAQQARRDQQRVHLEQALVRLAEGSYGECDDCGEPIAPARLHHNPAVTLCISCASA